MIKNMNKYIGLSIVALSMLFVSCNDWLDKLPDDRATVNTEEKVAYLLVNAYATHSVDFMMEQSSDNVVDNGSVYPYSIDQTFMYSWTPIEAQGNDDPYSVWTSHYLSVAVANECLAAIDKMGNPASLNGEKAEALLCRAYSVFRLSNAFCMAYDPEKADHYLGLPYPTESGVEITDRGTLAELYAKINHDIEEALPLLDDAHLTVPKYHFNTKAAYAFAARFNLYYHNYERAIRYATMVLGDKPASQLRNLESYMTLAGSEDICNAYLRTSEPANLMMQTAYSTLGRAPFSYSRYASNYDIVAYELIWPKMPWGNGSTDNTLYYSHMLYGTNQGVAFPKLYEQFEIKDKVLQTGYPHIVDAVFTTDETLLVRAEAYALRNKAELNDVENALADINLWIGSHCEEKRGGARRPVMTEALVDTTMNNIDYMDTIPATGRSRTIKKHLHPQGFTIDEEGSTQECLLQFILHLRRMETWQQGLRFQDIKRYGIPFSHTVDGAPALIFLSGDPRGAIQLPSEVIAAGLAPNDYTVPETALPAPDDESNAAKTRRYTGN